MRLGHRTLVIFGIVILGVGFFATAAHAAPGDYHLLSGTLVWPQVLMTERLAVVRGDDGITYFAELGSPEGLPHVKAGDRVAVVGREGIEPGQLTTATVTPVPPGVATPNEGNDPSASPSTSRVPAPGPAPAVVTLGPSTESISGHGVLLNGDTLTLTANGQWISVDVSRIDQDVKAALLEGQPVRVLAERTDGHLVAQGIVIEHGTLTVQE